MNSSQPPGQDPAEEPARKPEERRTRLGWFRQNYTLLLILLVPGLIGLLALAVMKVRRLPPPTPADLAYWTAARFVEEGEYSAALHHASAAALADPDRLDVALLHARLRLGRRGEALARCRSDLERRLDENAGGDGAGAVHALLARIYEDTDRDRSAAHRRAATELQPRTAAACYLRSVSTPHAEEVFAWLDRGLSIDRDHVPSLKASALAFFRLRRFEEMQAVLRRADKGRPGDASTLVLVGFALRAHGDPDGALAIQDTVVRLRPGDAEAYRQRSLTHLLRRDFGRAADDAAHALRLAAPELRRLYQAHRLRTLVAAGRLEELEREFLEAPAESRGADSVEVSVAKQAAFEEYVAGRDLKVPQGREDSALFRDLLEAGRLARRLEVGRRLARRAFGASFAPDGGRVAFARGRPGASRIEILNLESGDVTTPGPDGSDPAWSPDGSLIAFVRQDVVIDGSDLAQLQGRTSTTRDGAEVWLMTPEGREVRRLIAGGAPAWSRDAKRVYFLQGGALKSVAIAGDDPSERVHLETTSPFASRVSPDERLVCTQELEGGASRLRVVRLDSGDLVRSWDSPRREVKSLTATWSPSGRELAVSGRPGDGVGLWTVHAESGDARRILEGDAMAAVWSPDGASLIVELRAPYWELWMIAADRLPETP